MHVEPAHVSAYAGQLFGIMNGAFEDMGAYAKAHLTDTTEIGGLLGMVSQSMDSNGEQMAKTCQAAQRNIEPLALALHAAAGDYISADTANSEEIKSAGAIEVDIDGDGVGLHETWKPSDIGNEADASGEYSTGPDLKLKKPKIDTEFVDRVSAELEEMFGGMLESAEGMVDTTGEAIADGVDYFFGEGAGDDVRAAADTVSGKINDLIKWLTGYDLYGKITETVIGNPSPLHAFSTAWGELEAACLEVSEDMTTGMDTLDKHWQSEPDGQSYVVGAAIRESWVPGMEALAGLCNLGQQTCKGAALAYENIVLSLIGIAKLFMAKIHKLLKKLLKARKNMKDYGQILEALWNVVTELWDVIVEVYEAIYRQCELFIQTLKSLWAVLETVVDRVQGDMEVFQTAPDERVITA